MKKIVATAVIAGFCAVVVRAEIPQELRQLLQANPDEKSQATQRIWLAKYFLANDKGPEVLECLLPVHEQHKNYMAQADAQVLIGEIYLYGKGGVPVNLALAQQYITLAAGQKKNAQAREEANRLMLRLKDKQRNPSPEMRQHAQEVMERHLKHISTVPAGANGAGAGSSAEQ